MANLREIRNRIGSIKSTQQITKAMKMVAAAKLRKAQQKMMNNRPYAAKLSEVLGRLVAQPGTSHPLFSHIESSAEQVLYITVGSDKGLCGAFNNNLLKSIEQSISEQNMPDKDIHIVAIGRKMTKYFSKQKYTVAAKHEGFFDKLNYASTSNIAKFAIDSYLNGVYKDVYICYNEFKSVIAQNRLVEHVLPVQNVGKEQNDTNIDYIYEKDQTSILNELVPKHIAVRLWKAVLESNASEQGARMTAMDNATENAKDLEKSLKLQYNRARQDSITTELTEIVSGASALEGK
jgi:F-type H+-transporting ATPase subunit gamma